MVTKRLPGFMEELTMQLILVLASGLMMSLLMWWVRLPDWKKARLLASLARAGRNSSLKAKDLTGYQQAEITRFVRTIYDWEREQYAKWRSPAQGDSSAQSD